MSKVYIPQEPVRWRADLGLAEAMKDFTPALKYGELVVCLPPNISSHFTAPIEQALFEKMRNFTKDDYLISVGSPVVMHIASVIAAWRTNGHVNILTWDKRQREYLLNRIEHRIPFGLSGN